MSRLRRSYVAMSKKHFDGTQDWLSSYGEFCKWFYANTDLNPELEQFSIRQRKRNDDWSGKNMKVVLMTNIPRQKDDDFEKCYKNVSVFSKKVADYIDRSESVKLSITDWRDIRDEVNLITSHKGVQFNLEKKEGYVIITR